MSFLKKYTILSIIFFIFSCTTYKLDNKSEDIEKQYFSSFGFALIYDDTLFENKFIKNKLNNDKLIAVHSKLKKNTPIQIINPANSKVVETKIYKQFDYPKIFNILISKKIANELGVDINNPYVELHEIKKNKTFVAEPGSIFEEEKNVADKVPINDVEIADLSKSKKIVKKKLNEKKSFYLVIGDFYYIESAVNLRNEIVNKTNINNLSIKEIKANQHRLYAGPFKNFNSLKSTYISLNNLGFDDLNVLQK